MTRRFPPPWKVGGNESCYWVEDAEGKRLAYAYFASEQTGSSTGNRDKLTPDEARRIAANVAKLPDLLAKRTVR